MTREEELVIERAYADGSIFSDSARDTIIEPMVFCDCPFCAEEAATESEGGPDGGGDVEASPES